MPLKSSSQTHSWSRLPGGGELTKDIRAVLVADGYFNGEGQPMVNFFFLPVTFLTNFLTALPMVARRLTLRVRRFLAPAITRWASFFNGRRFLARFLAMSISPNKNHIALRYSPTQVAICESQAELRKVL